VRFTGVSILTERLLLRPVREGDEAALVSGLDDPEVARWLESVPSPYTLRDARAWIERCAREREAGFMQDFAITLAASGELVGGIAITPSRVDPSAEIGYWIARVHWGKGYGGEALARVVRHASEECSPRFERLRARVDPANTPSRRMLERAGFVERGVSVDNGVERLRYER
jgi:RimJ/RimL family protein N-acetyltransferase